MTRCHRAAQALRASALALALTGASAGAGLTADLVTASGAYAVDPGKGTAGYCPDGNGVTVVIDFQELGGTTIVRCAPGEQETGLTALKNAGIEIAGTNRWGEAFICRIEGKPGPESEPCIDTPPASAYWSYWYASDGGSWNYSQWGVMNRKPPLGSFEGWSFSKDKTEDTNPPPRVAPQRPAAGGSSDDSSGGGRQDGSGSGKGTGSPHTPAGDQAAQDHGSTQDGTAGEQAAKRNAERDGPAGKDERKTADTASAGPSASTSGDPLPGTAVRPSEAPEWTGAGDDGLQPAASAGENAIPTSTVIGIAAVTVLAAGAGTTAWHRRRAARADSPS